MTHKNCPKCHNEYTKTSEYFQLCTPCQVMHMEDGDIYVRHVSDGVSLHWQDDFTVVRWETKDGRQGMEMFSRKPFDFVPNIKK